tara:strand:+ start:70025 stop:70222 length:198 start_codon:yes stop_codon:yes gene_type:complete
MRSKRVAFGARGIPAAALPSQRSRITLQPWQQRYQSRRLGAFLWRLRALLARSPLWWALGTLLGL